MANISKKITLSFTPEEVEDILREYAENIHEITRGRVTVKFNIAKEARGYGAGEYDEIVFKGADVVVES